MCSTRRTLRALDLFFIFFFYFYLFFSSLLSLLSCPAPFTCSDCAAWRDVTHPHAAPRFSPFLFPLFGICLVEAMARRKPAVSFSASHPPLRPPRATWGGGAEGRALQRRPRVWLRRLAKKKTTCFMSLLTRRPRRGGPRRHMLYLFFLFCCYCRCCCCWGACRRRRCCCGRWRDGATLGAAAATATRGPAVAGALWTGGVPTGARRGRVDARTRRDGHGRQTMREGAWRASVSEPGRRRATRRARGRGGGRAGTAHGSGRRPRQAKRVSKERGQRVYSVASDGGAARARRVCVRCYKYMHVECRRRACSAHSRVNQSLCPCAHACPSLCVCVPVSRPRHYTLYTRYCAAAAAALSCSRNQPTPRSMPSCTVHSGS